MNDLIEIIELACMALYLLQDLVTIYREFVKLSNDYALPNSHISESVEDFVPLNSSYQMHLSIGS